NSRIRQGCRCAGESFTIPFGDSGVPQSRPPSTDVFDQEVGIRLSVSSFVEKRWNGKLTFSWWKELIPSVSDTSVQPISPGEAFREGDDAKIGRHDAIAYRNRGGCHRGHGC